MSPQYDKALVTGATSGIGRAIATALAEAGHAVTGLARDAGRLQELHASHGVIPLPCDLRDRKALSAALANADFDVLVNNAGVVASTRPFPGISEEEIDVMIDINLTAALQVTRRVVGGMIERGRGHIVFIGSTSGRYPHPNTSVYSASKAAISLFCDVLRSDLAGTGVRVTEICPGRVETELYEDLLGKDGAARLYQDINAIQPEDVASLVLTALRLPKNVDLSRIELFPTSQTLAGSKFDETR